MRLALTIQTPEVPKQVPITLLSGTLETKLEKAAGLGADGVELVSTEPGTQDPGYLRDLLDRFGLQAAAIASGGMAFAAGLTLLHPDAQVAALAQRRLLELIDFAFHLGAEVVTVGSFRGRAVGDKTASLRQLAEILTRAGDAAGERNVRLALEPLNRYEADLLNNSTQAFDFLAELDHPRVGLLLDTFHGNIEERSWTEPYRRAMAAGKLFHVHLADNNRLPPGQGLIDFATILQVLNETGYQGWLSAELLPQPDLDTAAAQTVTYIHQLMGKTHEA